LAALRKSKSLASLRFGSFCEAGFFDFGVGRQTVSPKPVRWPTDFWSQDLHSRDALKDFLV
jgi:hypothetical protein